MRKKYMLVALVIALLSQSGALAATKEEVVYTTLNSNGSIDNTVVVNSFKLDGEQSITDYGNYKNLKNLSSTQKPVVNEGKIAYNTEGLTEFYYQGTKEDGELPWLFDIDYKLNGKSISGESMIGKSGKGEIKLGVKLNPRANDYYKNNYLVQITLTLDTEICKNIVCDGAMVADVGSNKQLTLMVLPTRSKIFTIKFDAKNFEMNGFTIAIVKLSEGLLGSTLDNASVTVSSVTSGISALLDGSGQLKNGASDLISGIGLINTGSKSVTNSMSTIASGADELTNGASQLEGGTNELSDGASKLRSGLFTLDSKTSQISNGISSIEGGLKQMTGNTKKIKTGLDELKAKKNSVDTLASSGKTLTDGYASVYAGITTMANGYEEALKGQQTLSGYSSLIGQIPDDVTFAANVAGVNQILDAFDAMVGDDPVKKAYVQALRNYVSQTSGAIPYIKPLYNGAVDATDNLVALTKGANDLKAGMETLNTGLAQYTSGAGSVVDLYNTAITFGDAAYSLSSGADKLYDGAKTLSNGFNQYSAGIGDLADGAVELDNGVSTLKTGVSSLSSGASTLSTGISTLSSVTDELGDGIDKLATSANALPDGAQSLENGTKQLFDGVSGVDIAGMLSKGENEKPVSFAAPNVAKVEKVQFLIKTPNLKKPDETAKEVPNQNKGFFAKLLALFGIK